MASHGLELHIFVALCICTRLVHSFVKLECDESTVGQHGHQVVLTCVIKPEENDGDVKVRALTWKKDGDEIPLLMFGNGNITPKPGYKLAVPSWDETNLNISLLITHTKIADIGSYECQVVTDTGDDTRTMRLQLKARYSKPEISELNDKDTRALVCTSQGGYPKGALRWLVENDTDWTKGAQTEVKTLDSGLFQLTSTLPLLPSSTFSKYTCIVVNASRIKEDEKTYEPEQHPSEHTAEDPEAENATNEFNKASKVIAPVVVIGSLIVGLLLVLIYKRRSQKARRPSTAPLMDGWRGVQSKEEDVEGGDTGQEEK